MTVRGWFTQQGERFFIETCFRCKTPFAMSAAVYEMAQARKGELSFYCPNGHGQVYCKGESEETKLRRERDRLKQEQARLHDSIRHQQARAERAERSASGYKGAATRMKNRAKAGVCPCCNRSFQNLRRHMESQHPETDLDKVVELGQRA